MRKNIKRLIPFAILIVLIVLVYVTNLHQVFTLDWLREKERMLFNYVQNYPFLAPLIYIGFYIVSVCLIIPDSTILTLLGGLVFPLPLAISYAVISETVGAAIFFWIFQSTFGSTFLTKERPFIAKLRRGFRRNSKSYLLFLRLSHVVPFWITNVSAAYFKVNYWTFVWTTFVGVIPLSAILADAGNSLSELFMKDQTLKISDIFTTEIKITLLILGILALCPIVYKKFIQRKKWKL